MSSDYTDKPRLLQFTADGKTNLLLPTRFTATERMSALFQVKVELLVQPDKASQVKADQLLGKRMTLRVSHGEDYASGPYRYFDGMCSRFAAVGEDSRFHYFEAELSPWAWLLTKRANFRVYQDQTVLDIVKSVFSELQQDFSQFSFEVRGKSSDYKKLDYCVQFHETHFNFVSRLLEENGLYYYFSHDDSGHKLIVDDSLTAGGDVPDQATVRWSTRSGVGPHEEDCVTVWREERVIHSGSFAARDYHSQLAANRIDYSGISSRTSLAGNSKLEVFEWPSGSALRYNQTDQRLDEVSTVGDQLTNLRAQASETTHHTFSGSSSCRGFTPGYRISLEHDSGSKYLLTEVQHSAVQNANYITGEAVESPYTNRFVCIPADVQFRPQRIAPKPTVEGLQTAKVVGKEGEEIWIDKYGRIRVQFFWDRKGQNNETSTCWVRVAQIAAGKRWGASFWPRIGQEVLVAFVEGDPDQPVVVGTVYNNQQMPPYLGDGPDDKHKVDPNISGIKTNSTKGGDGYNELRFNDTADQEQVFIHGEKDMDVRVKNEYREQTIKERHILVGDQDNDDALLNQKIFGGWNMHTLHRKLEKVEGNVYLTVGMGDDSDGGNLHEYIEKDRLEEVGGKYDLTVGGSHSEKVSGQFSLTAGSADAKVDQGVALEAGTTLHLKGMSVVIEADMQLSLKVGGNFVDISAAGVAINGTMLMLNSGGAAGSGPGARPASPTEPDHASQDKPPADWFHAADNSKTGSKSCS